MADESPIADVDAALVLETAAAVDENILAETDVLAEVSAERREELEGLRDLKPSQLLISRTQIRIDSIGAKVMGGPWKILGRPVSLPPVAYGMQ